MLSYIYIENKNPKNFEKNYINDLVYKSSIYSPAARYDDYKKNIKTKKQHLHEVKLV